MKWKPKNQSNSVAIVQIRPRISMIGAIDTRGNVYLSLTNCNSNNQIMEIFFRQLVAKLDKENPYWRENTIITLDNASYHNHSNMFKLYESLRIPIMFVGPHSYQTASMELFFAHFKSVSFNPENIPLGKR